MVALHPADGKVVTIDPATGWVARRWADFDAEWLPGGRPSLVVLGPAPPAAARHHVDAAGLAPL